MSPNFAGCTPKQLVALFAFALLIFTSISCDNDDEDEMPPYSTSGANIFGAYVNGQLWLPKGKPDLFTPSFLVIYEGGDLSVRAHRRINENSPDSETIVLNRIQVDHEGVYTWDDNTDLGSTKFFGKRCEYSESNPNIYRRGTLEITKLDMKSGIIAGKFEFILAEPGCDTLKVTGGRFDYNLF